MHSRLPFLALPVLLGLAPDLIAQQKLRAWHHAGQTFLVWEHSGATVPETYEIHASRRPILSLSHTKRVGTVFGDNGANYRLDPVVKGMRWVLPSPSGPVKLGPNESYFVRTTRNDGTSYYAVTAGQSRSPPASVGPITEKREAVTCHLQFKNSGVSVYAHWIDGDADPGAGTPSYPIMGNEYANGTGFNFCVWEPRGGRKQIPPGYPLLCGFHGRDGDLFDYAPIPPGRIGLVLSVAEEAMVATFDDGLRYQSGPRTRSFLPTYFFGYQRGFNPFELIPANDGEKVTDYSARRILWELGWIERSFPIDRRRVAAMGASMGGAAALYLSQAHPERFAACLVHVPVFDLVRILDRNMVAVFGAPSQRLRTDLPGAPEVYKLLDLDWRLANRPGEWPFTRMFFGKLDQLVGWSRVPAMLRSMNSKAKGAAVYWDERSHLAWAKAHFLLATRNLGARLTAFNRTMSYPAFYDVDLDFVAPGIQPDPGNGSPLSGDPWGTWGGYLSWNPQSVLDHPGSWEAQLEILDRGIHPSEICPVSVLEASVVPRRRSLFRPAPNAMIAYDLREQRSGRIVSSGTVKVAASGELRIPRLRISKLPSVLRLFPATKKGRSPVYFDVTQPNGPGSVTFRNQGLRPGSIYVNMMSFHPAPDGATTGWAFGLSLRPWEEALLSIGPPFVGVASGQGTATFSVPRGILPPVQLEVFNFELDPLFGLGSNSGPRLFDLK